MKHKPLHFRITVRLKNTSLLIDKKYNFEIYFIYNTEGNPINITSIKLNHVLL